MARHRSSIRRTSCMQTVFPSAARARGRVAETRRGVHSVAASLCIEIEGLDTASHSSDKLERGAVARAGLHQHDVTKVSTMVLTMVGGRWLGKVPRRR